MVKVVTVQQMRDIERAADASGVTYAQMMEHAGRAVAEVVKGRLGSETADKRVAVLVGKGNNGGDGLVAARILKQETSAEIGCYVLAARPDDDPVYAATKEAGVFLASADQDQRWRVLKNLVANADIIVDALLGTGARLPIDGDLKKLLNAVSESLDGLEVEALTLQSVSRPSAPVFPTSRRPIIVAVDCPSGLNCDTGDLDPAAVKADATVTFAAAKRGEMIFPGADAVGELVVAEIGVPQTLPELTGANLSLAIASDIAARLPPRPRDAHKGTFGCALIVAGSINYTGAAALAGKAAYRAGAGLVRMAVPEIIYPILSTQFAEAIWLLLPHEMGAINASAVGVLASEAAGCDAALIGPGLGRDPETLSFLRTLLAGESPVGRARLGFGADAPSTSSAPPNVLPPRLVIDADGLNLLAEIEEWPNLLPDQTVLTPHPGEMARLTGMSMPEVQANRVELAQEKAADWNCVVVLKGAFTVIAAPDGQAIMIPVASDALATAGTGDVLAGCITGLIAQGLSAFDAAVAGTYVHGRAGQLAAEALGTRSVMAGDVLNAIAKALVEIQNAGA